MKKAAAFAVAAIASTACMTRLAPPVHKVAAPGVVNISAEWIKDKGRKFDMGLRVENSNSRPIHIQAQDASCYRGEGYGQFRKTLRADGEGILLEPGQRKTFVIVCDDTGTTRGDFRILVGRVLDASSGTLLAKDFELRYADDGTPRDTSSPTIVAADRAAPSIVAVTTTPKVIPSPEPQPSQLTAEKKGWIIAVMNVRFEESKSEAVTLRLAEDIGDQLRVFLAEGGLRTVDRGTQERVLREQVRSLKEESYQACYDDNCQIELGKALAASHVLRSNLARFGSQCVLNAELIDLSAEVSIAAASARGPCEPEAFLNMSETLARRLTSS